MKTQNATGNRARIGRWLASTALACMIGHVVPASAVTGLTAVGLPFYIDLFSTSTQNYDYQVSVSLAADGSGAAAWTFYTPVSGYTYIMARRFAADGSPIGSEVFVDVAPGAPNSEQNPLVASDAAGNFVVTWTQWDGTSAQMRLFGADGTPRTDAACIKPDCSVSSPLDLAMDNAGDFAVLSYAQASPSIYLFHADGSAGTVVPVPVGSGTTLLSAAIAMDRTFGKVNLAWLQDKPLKQKTFYSSMNFQTFLQRYNADGSIVGKADKVFNCNYTYYSFSRKSYGCNANAVSLAQDDSGNSEVAWWENDYKGSAISSYIYARGYDSNNGTDSDKTKVSPAPTDSAFVVTPPIVRTGQPGAAFIVGWTSQDNSAGLPVHTSVVQSIGLNGILFGPAVQFPANDAHGSSGAPVLAANSAGNVIGIWPGRASDFSEAWIQGQFYLQQ